LSEAAFSLVGNLAEHWKLKNGAGVFVWEGFPGQLLISRLAKTEISATGPAQYLLIIYEHIKILTKEVVVRRVLGNRASPVN